MRFYIVYALFGIAIILIAAWFLAKPQQVVAPSTTEVASSTAATSTATTTAPVPASRSSATRATAPSGPTPLQSLQSLVRNMGNTTCSYQQVSTGSTARSVDALYISGGKIRGEFRSTTPQGISTNTIMLFNGTTLYTWTEGMISGTASSVHSASDVATLLPQSLGGNKTLGTSDNNVSWDCHPWIPVVSMLTLPAGVTFK